MQNLINKLVANLVVIVLLQALTNSACGRENGFVSTLQYGHASGWNCGLDLEQSQFLSKVWDIEVGEGRSQIVGDGKAIYVAAGVSKKNKTTKRTKLDTKISAILIIRNVQPYFKRYLFC